jgi:hypothetical protein
MAQTEDDWFDRYDLQKAEELVARRESLSDTPCPRCGCAFALHLPKLTENGEDPHGLCLGCNGCAGWEGPVPISAERTEYMCPLCFKTSLFVTERLKQTEFRMWCRHCHRWPDGSSTAAYEAESKNIAKRAAEELLREIGEHGWAEDE